MSWITLVSLIRVHFRESEEKEEEEGEEGVEEAVVVVEEEEEEEEERMASKMGQGSGCRCMRVGAEGAR